MLWLGQGQSCCRAEIILALFTLGEHFRVPQPAKIERPNCKSCLSANELNLGKRGQITTAEQDLSAPVSVNALLFSCFQPQSNKAYSHTKQNDRPRQCRALHRGELGPGPRLEAKKLAPT